VTGPRGTVMRCVIAGVALPGEWQTYITALRAITGAKVPGDPTQALPTRPPYPAGT